MAKLLTPECDAGSRAAEIDDGRIIAANRQSIRNQQSAI